MIRRLIGWARLCWMLLVATLKPTSYTVTVLISDNDTHGDRYADMYHHPANGGNDDD